MKSGKLVVFALLGLVVLGYAVFELAGSDDAGLKSRDAYGEGAGDGAGEWGPEARKRARGRGGAGEPGAGAGERAVVPVAPSQATPPPPPPPPMPLDQARKQYQDYIAELSAVKDEGRILSNDEWTEYYRRGNEVLDPLVRALDSADPVQAQEVNDAHTKFRELIMGMEPNAAAAAAAAAQ